MGHLSDGPEGDPEGIHEAGNSESREMNVLGANGPMQVPNERVPPAAVNHKKEMKRYRSFAIALFATTFTMSVYALSSSCKLEDYTKSWILVYFIIMFLVSSMTMITTYVEGGIFGCKPGVSVSLVCVSLLLQVIYIVDISILVLYSFSHRRNMLYAIGVSTDLVTALFWINIWKRPKRVYSSCFMVTIRNISWSITSGVLTYLGCAEEPVLP